MICVTHTMRPKKVSLQLVWRALGVPLVTSCIAEFVTIGGSEVIKDSRTTRTCRKC